MIRGRDERIEQLNRERDGLESERDSMRESIASLGEKIKSLERLQESTLLSQTTLAEERDKKAKLVTELTKRLETASQLIRKLRQSQTPAQIKELEQQLEQERLDSA